MISILNNRGLNHQWASIFIEELSRLGLKKLVLSPGGRSMSLAISSSEHKSLKVFTAADERGAGFFALGLSKGSSDKNNLKEPIALLSTSGTAIANYYPAVLEASTLGIPLIIITTDLPTEQSDSGEMQSFRQVDFFQKNVRWSKDFSEPTVNFSPENILTSLSTAFSKALSFENPGPVHLNCRFNKPLLEEENSNIFYKKSNRFDRWLQSKEPFTEKVNSFQSEPRVDKKLIELIKNSKSLLISTGSSSHILNNQESSILNLAKKFSWPLLLDLTNSGIVSSSNISEVKEVVSRSSLSILNTKESPEVIIHFGRPPLQNSINNFLKNSSSKIILIDPSPERLDPWHSVYQRHKSCPEKFAERLIEALSSSNYKGAENRILSNLKETSLKVEERLSSSFVKKTFSEFNCAKTIFNETKPNSLFFIGNSISVRAFDLAYDASKPFKTVFNRGLSGIDGLIATAAGFFEANSDLVKKNSLSQTLVLGDVSFYHDLNSLALLNKIENPSICLVLNNSGGQIFSTLPRLSSVSSFEECFITKQDINLKDAAKCFSLNYHTAQNEEQLKKSYTDSKNSSKSCLIEVNIASSAYLDTLNFLTEVK